MLGIFKYIGYSQPEGPAVTFNSRGVPVGDHRGVLVADALEHLAQPWVQYVAVQTEEAKSAGADCSAFAGHMFEGRSQAEAVVALFDFLNENDLNFGGADRYVMSQQSPGSLSADSSTAGVWLLEVKSPEHCNRAQLPGRLTKPARPDAGEGAAGGEGEGAA